MANTPEGKVKAAITKWLRSQGIWYCMPVGSMYMSAGVPDILCCWHGFFVAIEVKAPGKESNTTALQDLQIAKIQESGGVAIVTSCIEDVWTIFNFLGGKRAHESIPTELQGRGGKGKPRAPTSKARPHERPVRLREEARRLADECAGGPQEADQPGWNKRARKSAPPT